VIIAIKVNTGTPTTARGIETMATLEEIVVDDQIEKELANSSTDDIVNRTRLLENDIKVAQRFSVQPAHSRS